MPPSPQRRYSGPQRAAIVLLALGDKYGKTVWEALNDEEVRTISAAMAHLGMVEAEHVENLIGEFATKVNSGTVYGDLDNTRQLLSSLLPPDRVAQIMDEIGSKSDRSTWHRLSMTHETVLANYLKTELPQTAALILARLSPQQAAKVIALLPREQAAGLVDRMLTAGHVTRPVLERIEETLRQDFMTNALREMPSDAVSKVAEIVNHLDRGREATLLADLARINGSGAEQVKALLFTFDDLMRLDRRAMQILVSRVDRTVLAKALKGTTEMLKRSFTAGMAAKQQRLLEEEIESLGPVRLKEIDLAQGSVLQTAKSLEEGGLIALPQGNSDDELVY